MNVTLWRRIYHERRGVVLPLLVALIANIAVLALGVLPLKRAVVNADEAARLTTLALAEARRDDLRAKAARSSKERADVELQKFYAEILPRNYRSAVSVADFWLSRTADESRLLFKSGQWDREDIRGSRLTKVTSKVTLTGDYGNIRRFLYNVETAEEFVIIEKVELSQTLTSQNSNVLEVALSVATYYVTNPETAASK